MSKTAGAWERASALLSDVRQKVERLRSVEGIRVRAGAALPLRALLVDDVVTTGSTLAACAAALEAAGVREVAAIAYARTPGR